MRNRSLRISPAIASFLAGLLRKPGVRRSRRPRIKGPAEQFVECHVPPRGIVAVISKGNPEWSGGNTRQAWLFPCNARGDATGMAPACDLAAIAQLETLRARGATHLLIPETCSSWLTTYPGFRRHLDCHSSLIQQQPGVGSLYDLSPRPAAAATNRSFAESFDDLAKRLGRPPQVLDFTSISGPQHETQNLFPGAHRFSPPSPGPHDPETKLPYIDSSIDIVAVASPTPELLAEARRVATYALVDCVPEPQIEWLRQPPAVRLPSVSIIMPVFNQWPVTKGCLQALWASLPRECTIEVLVSDDASTDETAQALASLLGNEPRLKVLRNEKNSGFVTSCNRAAAAATGEVLLFVNNDTVPLPGWLEPLLGTFALFPKVGAVGGKLLFPDGRLQEAGGIIFSDASAYHFGSGGPNATASFFHHVRQVDYVSGAFLATPRSLFADFGGFDPDFAPGFYEDTDYCFRLRERGYAVYYQPEAVVVHLKGATAGDDHAVGMKRYQEINRERFRARHAVALQEQRQRPNQIDASSWLELSHRGRGWTQE